MAYRHSVTRRWCITACPGIAAGRLLEITEAGRWSLGDAGPDDIVAVERSPDDLPPGNGLITGTPLTPLASITAAVVANFVNHAPEKGLRFRSSSTVEDIEGFNGSANSSHTEAVRWRSWSTLALMIP
ncbi:MAG: hypothetical protein ACI8V4_003050 [Ilumatobacter sp.]